MVDTRLTVSRATKVPVGDDQIQHLEFARECATNFNHAYGNILSEARTVTCEDIPTTNTQC